MKKNQIISILKKKGFKDTGERGIRRDPVTRERDVRMENPKLGRYSVYVNDNWLSATGVQRNGIAIYLQSKHPSNNTDHKGYPVWTDDALKDLLTKL